MTTITTGLVEYHKGNFTLNFVVYVEGYSPSACGVSEKMFYFNYLNARCVAAYNNDKEGRFYDLSRTYSLEAIAAACGS